MGLSIEIVVSYNNHTFSRISNGQVDQFAQYGVGYTPIGSMPKIKEYFVTGSSSISYLDFEDVTNVTINVELAGGRCNRTLGNAFVNFKRDLCPNYLRQVNIQTFQTPVVVFADFFTVEFDSLDTGKVNFDLEVGRYLHATLNDSAVVDARNVSKFSSDIYTTVRFEYHPQPTLSIAYSAAAAPTCADPKSTPPDWVCLNSGFALFNVTHI